MKRLKRLAPLIISLVVVASIYAQPMASYFKQKFLGLNTRVNPKLIADDESPDLINFSLDETGAIVERDIFARYNSSPGDLGNNAITGLFKHYTASSKYFIACAGTKVCLGTGGVFTNISNTANTVTPGTYWSGVSFNQKFYMFNPSIEMQVYDGTHTNIYQPAGVGQIPDTDCSYCAVHRARLWAARSDIAPYRIYYTEINVGEDWYGYIDLPDLTANITGLCSWGGTLYVFTETTIYALQGYSENNFNLVKTNSDVGAVAPRSIRITDKGIFFLARTGVFVFNGTSSSKISDKIDPTINSISKTNIQNACGLWDGQSKYWLSFTPGTSNYNSKILIFDATIKEWYFYNGDTCNISYFERAYGGTDKGELYGGSSVANGYVYLLQEASGTESITHQTKADYTNGVTYNTVVVDDPGVVLDGVERNWTDDGTLLLMHLDGVDGGVGPGRTDDKNYRVWTMGGSPAGVNHKISTANKKFGNASYWNSSSAGMISVDNSGDWDLSAVPKAWTIEYWVNMDHLPGGDQYNVINRYLVPGPFPYQGFVCSISDTVFTIACDSGTTLLLSCPHSMVSGEWHHIAFSCTGTLIRAFLDGQLKGSIANPGLTNYNGTLNIGGDGGTRGLHGYVDEVRISNVCRYTANFTPMRNNFPYARSGGALESPNIQINNAGATTLGKISWIDDAPTNTKIAFQTRTGVTNDSVNFNGWQYWSSANTVSLLTVTPDYGQFRSNGQIYAYAPFPSKPDGRGQRRTTLGYEDEHNTSVNCVEFKVSGASQSARAYADAFITYTDLSDYDWLTVWFKSPQTGNTVVFYMANDYGSLSNNYVTFNTVTHSTVSGWQKGYWYIGDIPDSEKNGIRYLRLKYMGEQAGSLYLGEVNAQNFYDTDDTMTSTPNDWIQYRAIFGTDDPWYNPELYQVTLIYNPVSSEGDTALNSYYYTKYIDFGKPMQNKAYLELFLEANVSTTNTVIYCDYDCDYGNKSGTLAFNVGTTASTVRVKRNFPSSTFGKTLRMKFYNNDLSKQVTIRGCEVRYREENLND